MWALREVGRAKSTYPFINIRGLVQGPGCNTASGVNEASALRSLAFYGGDKIVMHCDVKKNRSGERAASLY